MDNTLPAEAYEELIGHTVDVITVLDETGTVQYESPSIERVLGYTPDELLGENAFDYVHPDDRQRIRQAFADVVGGTHADAYLQIEFRFKRRDGSWTWVESRGTNRTVDDVGGYVVTSRDISERKAYEQQLRQETDRLERLVSIVSHDLRNPLTVARGNLELSQEEYESEHLDAIDEALSRMHDLVEDILTLAREGDALPEPEVVSLPAVADRCWQHVDTDQASLTVDTDRHIVADDSQLQQLLENLFRNAVEHGGEDVNVTVGDLSDGFYVEDDGQGLPTTDAARLLENGFSTRTDGTGLGLSIVGEIVANHEWRLTITEGTAGGARFEISDVELA